MTKPPETRKQHRWHQFSLQTLLLFVAVVAAMLSLYAVFVRPNVEHKRLVQRFDLCIEQLTQKRPTNVTRQQWSYVIGWTMNARGNCLTVRQWIDDYPRFRRFVEDLERKVEGNVGIETIDWIWDEIEQNSRPGKSYSNTYRPTTPDRLNSPDVDWGITVK